MAIHNNSLFGGIFQIEGGNDQFTKHLIEKCKSNNVEIKTSASVKNCIIEN